MGISSSSVRVNVTTQSITYVSEGVVDLFEAIITKLGLSTKYTEEHRDALLSGFTTWLREKSLEKVYLVVEEASGRAWALGELRIDYLLQGQTADFYDDLEAARYAAAKLGVPPTGVTYRIIAVTSAGASAVSGWSGTTMPSTSGMTRSRVGGAVGAPAIEASLALWRRA